VIVYEMLAGLQPFDGTAMEIALANINSDPPPIQACAWCLIDPCSRRSRKLMARARRPRHDTQDALALLELSSTQARVARTRHHGCDGRWTFVTAAAVEG
jgi:hypothetical protein